MVMSLKNLKNLKFHADTAAIFRQMNKTLNLQYHGIFRIIWRHVKVFSRNVFRGNPCFQQSGELRGTVYAPEKLSTPGNQFIYTMEKINLWYSMKNIGITQNKIYLLHLIEKIEMVIKRMRWKVLFYVKKETKGIKTEWYGLKSSKIPKEVKDLIPFQNDLIAFVQKIRFRNPINHFPETDQYLWKINLKKQRGTTQKINGNGNK